MTEDELDELQLTPEQLKAAKGVYAAIRKASKIGVSFWDDYGRLAAFNSKKVTLPLPKEASKRTNSLRTHDVSYSEMLPRGAYYAGNADDELFYDIVQ